MQKFSIFNEKGCLQFSFFADEYLIENNHLMFLSNSNEIKIILGSVVLSQFKNSTLQTFQDSLLGYKILQKF